MNPRSVIDTVARIVKEELPRGYRLEKVDLGFGRIHPEGPTTFQAQILVYRNRPPANPAGWGRRVAERIRSKWPADQLGISLLELEEGQVLPFNPLLAPMVDFWRPTRYDESI